jgi:POT family proton-dependent oligopeptide transporter
MSSESLVVYDLTTDQINTLGDFQSALLDAEGQPTARQDPFLVNTKYDEKKEKDFAGAGVGEMTIVEDRGEDDPSPDEMSTLRRVSASMSWVAIAMCLIEMAERASYYGSIGMLTLFFRLPIDLMSSGPFNNFVNRPLPPGGNGAGAVAPGEAGLQQTAGALGLGSVAASAITTMFSFLAYVIPIFGGIVADTKWGRFKTICVGTAVGGIAHILLVIVSSTEDISTLQLTTLSRQFHRSLRIRMARSGPS